MMISIAEAIADLLLVRDTVVVPGLGAFVKRPVSAKVKPVANYFAMPSSTIEFNPSLREDNDLLANYLVEKNDVPEEEARKLVAMFVSDCFTNLKSGQKVVLNDIGTLHYDWAGDLAFEQAETRNYNADAFGLCDFTAEPVMRSKTKDEIKAEIAQQQKDKNTPVTVDEKAVHENDKYADNKEDAERHGRVWLWILLALLLVAAVVFGLCYFDLIKLDFWKGKRHVGPWEKRTYELPTYQPDWMKAPEPIALDRLPQDSVAPDQPSVTDTVTPERVVEEKPVAVDTVPSAPSETVTPVAQETDSPVAQQPTTQPATPSEANILIIVGCFSQKENAEHYAVMVKEKGYPSTFCEYRDGYWYVATGRYATDEEAVAAVREIWANTEYKAWILRAP